MGGGIGSIFIPLLAARLVAAAPAMKLKVDQVGFLTNSPKVAPVASLGAASEFKVCCAKDAPLRPKEA